MSLRPHITIHPGGVYDPNYAAQPPDDATDTEPDVDKAFAETPPVVFDLELPWENDCGRVKNKYGVVIAKFENWEQADAVVATMNGSQALVDAVARINDASVPVPAPAPEPVGKPAEGPTFEGVPILVNPAFTNIASLTQDEYERIADEIAKRQREQERALKISPEDFNRAAQRVAQDIFGIPPSRQGGLTGLRDSIL